MVPKALLRLLGCSIPHIIKATRAKWEVILDTIMATLKGRACIDLPHIIKHSSMQGCNTLATNINKVNTDTLKDLQSEIHPLMEWGA